MYRIFVYCVQFNNINGIGKKCMKCINTLYFTRKSKTMRNENLSPPP